MGLNSHSVSSQLADLGQVPSLSEFQLVFICKMGMLTGRVPPGVHPEHRAEPSTQEQRLHQAYYSVNYTARLLMAASPGRHQYQDVLGERVGRGASCHAPWVLFPCCPSIAMSPVVPEVPIGGPTGQCPPSTLLGDDVTQPVGAPSETLLPHMGSVASSL